MTTPGGELARLRRRGFGLEYASMAWMIVEAGVAITAGVIASSIAAPVRESAVASAATMIFGLSGGGAGEERACCQPSNVLHIMAGEGRRMTASHHLVPVMSRSRSNVAEVIRLQLDQSTIRINKTSHYECDLAGKGVLLIPCVFAGPNIMFDPGGFGPPTIVYGPRGLGTVWETSGASRSSEDALSA
jgi:hypothetical protein